MAWPAFANRLENPYNALLYSALRELDVEVVEFSVQRLLFGPRADILHLHWAPTTRIRGETRSRVKPPDGPNVKYPRMNYRRNVLC